MKLNSISIGNMRGKGWLKEYLDRQNQGITGHIEKCGEPFDTPKCLWETKDEPYEWFPYEQQGYWVDGALSASYLTDNRELQDRILKIIDNSIRLADEDGYIGPNVLKGTKNEETEGYMRWPHSVYFRALMTQADATGDMKIVEALKDFYKKSDYFAANGRNVCQIESLAWLYKKTGDTFYRDYAEDIFEAFQASLNDGTSLRMDEMISDRPFDEHGVTLCEIMKLLPILYDVTGKQRYLDIAVKAVDKLIHDCILVDGVISSEEFTRTNTTDMSHETCDIADFSWMLGYMFKATGDTKYLDIIERMCFNAAPAVVMPDFKAIQYFSSPNLTIADGTSTHCRYTRGMWTMSYRPYGYAACCIGNVNRIMPNFASKQWHEGEDGVLYATLYAPSVLKLDDMCIAQETEYPFSFDITFRIETKKKMRKTLAFRIPGWAKTYTLVLNGKEVDVLNENGFVKLTHNWNQLDILKLSFTAVPQIHETVDNGKYIDYGSILYAYEVPHDTEKFMAQEHECEFYSYSLHANGDWNYALREDLIQKEGLKPIYTGKTGFIWEEPRICFEVPAEKVSGWVQNHTDTVERWTYRPELSILDDVFVYKKIEGDFVLTPELPDRETTETTRDHEIHRIRLIPYGCAKLRITIFPYLTEDSCL